MVCPRVRFILNAFHIFLIFGGGKQKWVVEVCMCACVYVCACVFVLRPSLFPPRGGRMQALSSE